ncbi:hypothetical protein GMLC_13490 [Geomonas limicola]|uniref:Integrase catalytic domain-containing protein n=1 Tax=Geomonas limicola TaxID=2740186 RepID=A0A6V8N5U9_9BACT|nr:DDE-type integrase/transposase/recombinase [Geomonas limicola]GFO67770.1 hypothetical protein GMLC_13490 [Geomonas limicola]
MLAECAVIEWVVEEEKRTYMERILYVDRPAGQLVVIALCDDALPIWKCLEDVADAIAAGRAFRRADPYAWHADPLPEFLEKHAERRDRGWELIKDLVGNEPGIFNPEIRGKLIREAVESLETDRTELYRLLRRYWIRGKIKNALLPSYDRCGAPGKTRTLVLRADGSFAKRGRPSKISRLYPDRPGVNVDNGIAAIFDCAIKLYYHKQNSRSLKDAYDQMLDKHFSVGMVQKDGIQVPVHLPPWEQPTYPQFRYWYEKKLDLQEAIIKRRGQKRFNLENRPILGSSTQMAFGPGSIFQIDATIADIYLVSTLNRSWIIGRPVVYFVMDVFSRMCVGLYVGLEGPSWAGAMMAIANATCDKVAYCAEYGIPIAEEEWPCHYLPAKILADRGELIGRNADNLPDNLDITVENCPPYRGDLKGIVEQQFHRTKEKSVVWLPGVVLKAKERGTKDYRLDAQLDLYQFTQVMIYTILEYNRFHWMDTYEKELDLIRDDVRPIPLELWEWGIQNRVGKLKERSPEVIKVGLMPQGEATVTERGIRFEGVFYDTERALREQWYVNARSNKTWTIPVSYDPRQTDVIYWRCGGTTVFEPCNIIKRDSRFTGCRVEEVQQFFALEKLKATENLSNERQAGAELRAKREQIVKDAQEMTRKDVPAGLSKKERLDKVKKNRADEKQRNRKAEAYDLRPLREKKGPATVHVLDSEQMTEAANDNLPMTAAEKRKRNLEFLERD